MAFTNFHNILLLLVVVLMSVSTIWTRSLPDDVHTIVLVHPYEALDDGHFIEPYEAAESHIRHRRAAYDPYSQYYYYPSSLNPNEQYETPKKASTVSRRQADDDLVLQDGNKYKYTPLFQYKSTQSRRRKLFVPNLFG